MAEIILEPTTQSKVIPLSLKLNETNAALSSQFVTNRQFSTADTDAWFSFTLEGLAATTGTFDLTLINLNDKSVFNHTNKIFNTNPFYYKLDSGSDEKTNEIRHAGKWVGQLVVTLANGDSATRKFLFGIEGHILDGTVVQTILLEDYNALIATITSAKDELTQYNIDYDSLITTVKSQEAERVQAELNRETVFNALVDSAVIEQKVADKYTEVETTYANRLFSAEQQLADTLNKSAITLTHMFADNTARDAYFVANPSELMAQLFIKVGTGYQQYLEGAWQATTAIVAEQLSATNQPIVDTGNYFATDNTNAALQELGAHKASTSNPHGVTKSQVGLGDVDNTSDADKPISTATQAALNLKAIKPTNEETATNGQILASNGDGTSKYINAVGGGEVLLGSVVYDGNLAYESSILTIDTVSDTITVSGGHAFIDGDLVVISNYGMGTIPGGIKTNIKYYVISSNGTSFKLSATTGGEAVDITSSGGTTGYRIEKPSSFRTLKITGLNVKQCRVRVKCHTYVSYSSQSIAMLLNSETMFNSSDFALDFGYLYNSTFETCYSDIILHVRDNVASESHSSLKRVVNNSTGVVTETKTTGITTNLNKTRFGNAITSVIFGDSGVGGGTSWLLNGSYLEVWSS